jgi:hypothetical protein
MLAYVVSTSLTAGASARDGSGNSARDAVAAAKSGKKRAVRITWDKKCLLRLASHLKPTRLIDANSQEYVRKLS